MIEWLSTVNPNLLWLCFFLCAFIMALVPFYGKLKKILLFKFSNIKPEIKDFTWRLAPDHLLFKWKGKTYYLQSQGKEFILEGGSILLSWDVTGAYQIDISGVGTNLKGNTASIRASKHHNTFELIAHTSSGKLTQTLNLDPKLFRDLGTLNLSKEENFNQRFNELKTEKLTQLSWMNGKYQQGKLTNLPRIKVKTLLPKIKRYSFTNLLNQNNLANPLHKQKNRINIYIRQNKIVKTYRFTPKKYNDALNSVKK